MNSEMRNVRELPGYVDLDALMTGPPSDEPWIVDGLIAPQRLTALIGDAKIGKSILALQLAVAISKGDEVFGRPTTKTKVLYVDMENNPQSDIKQRLHRMGYGSGDFNNIIFLSFPVLPALDTKRGGEQLRDIVAKHNVGCVFLDTIARLVDGEENSNDTWHRLYKHTELLLKQLKVAVLRIDHTGKDGSKGARGGSAKSGDVDLVIRMTATRDGRITLRRDAGRTNSGFDVLKLERKDEPWLHHAISHHGSPMSTEDRVLALYKLLDDAGFPRGLTNAETRRALKSLGESCSKEISAEVTRRRKVAEPDLDAGEPRTSRPPDDSGSVFYWAMPSLTGTSRPAHRRRRQCLS